MLLFMADAKPDSAKDYLLKVIQFNNSYFFKDANWYLGLIALKEGKKEEAIQYIQQSDHPSKQALLQGLKN